MKKQHFFYIIVFSLLISCKDEIQTKINKGNFKITMVFPDTVYINEGYDGRIDYKNDLDTITTSFDDVKKARFLEYVFLSTKNINYKDDYLKKIAKDTFVAETNKIIPLYNIKFDKLGLNYIDGMITDEVMIENGAKDEKGEIMTRIITNEFRATKGVYVIKKHRPAVRSVPK